MEQDHRRIKRRSECQSGVSIIRWSLENNSRVRDSAYDPERPSEVVAQRRCTWADSVHPGNFRIEELSGPTEGHWLALSPVNLFATQPNFQSFSPSWTSNPKSLLGFTPSGSAPAFAVSELCQNSIPLQRWKMLFERKQLPQILENRHNRMDPIEHLESLSLLRNHHVAGSTQAGGSIKIKHLISRGRIGGWYFRWYFSGSAVAQSRHRTFVR